MFLTEKYDMIYDMHIEKKKKLFFQKSSAKKNLPYMGGGLKT